MKIIKKVKSWDDKNKEDCFGFIAPKTIDHIYPLSLDGSDAKINKQLLSLKANKIKANKTKGKIGGIWRFAILKNVKDDCVYGKMFIRQKDWPVDEWYEVMPVL